MFVKKLKRDKLVAYVVIIGMIICPASEITGSNIGGVLLQCYKYKVHIKNVVKIYSQRSYLVEWLN